MKGVKNLRNLIKYIAAPAALVTCLAGGMTQTADAQLVVVEERFRIVDVDDTENRIAIAKPDADPNVRQNWVYLDPDTKASARRYYGDGAFKDMVFYDAERIIDAAQAREGELFKVNGGRDWDGSIDADKIWL